MLEEVRITSLGVIEDAVLEFSSGLTVVTGETGAGKTMVVTGLGLMFGGRAEPARSGPVRSGPSSRAGCGSIPMARWRGRCWRQAGNSTTRAAR